MIVLQTTDGDIDISSGNLALVTDPAAETAQRLTNRFRLFRGEWYLDTRVGTPYFFRLLGVKNPDVPSIRRFLRSIVEGCPGVASVTTCDVSFDNAKRLLTTNIVAKAQSGAILQGQLGQAFVVAS